MPARDQARPRETLFAAPRSARHQPDGHSPKSNRRFDRLADLRGANFLWRLRRRDRLRTSLSMSRQSDQSACAPRPLEIQVSLLNQVAHTSVCESVAARQSQTKVCATFNFDVSIAAD